MPYIQYNVDSILNEDSIDYVLTKKDCDLLISQIDSVFLFNELVKISMKKADDTNVNIRDNNPQ